MNGRMLKKLRKLSHRDGIEYVKHLYSWPWRNRLLFAWHLVWKY